MLNNLRMGLRALAFAVIYIPSVLTALVLTVVANLLCWLIALFVDTKTGLLPRWLRWFQTPDATCYDDMWVSEHPTWSKYKIAYTWIARNPAYGFRKWAQTKTETIAVTKGDLTIADGLNGKAGWFLLLAPNGAFNFVFVIDLHNGSCLRGNWGWYLAPIAKGYESINTGMLEADLFRFYNFGSEGH